MGNVFPTPPNTPGFYEDGFPYIALGNTFARQSGSPAYVCTGGRVFTDPVTGTVKIRIMAFLDVKTDQNNLDTTPIRDVLVDVNTGGWTEVSWDPFTIPEPPAQVMIGYQFIWPADSAPLADYLHAGNSRPDINVPLESPDGDIVWPVADDGAGRRSSYFRSGSGAPGGSNAWYGADMVFEEPDSASNLHLVQAGSLVPVQLSGIAQGGVLIPASLA